MIRFRVLACLLPVLLLSGCFQLRALLRMAEDGSATLEESVLIGGMLREMMSADSSQSMELYVLDSLRANATQLGEGVTLLRVDTLRSGDDFGYRAVYEVADVRTLRFRFNPNPLPGAGQSTPRTSASFLAATSDDLALTFDRDEAGVLHVRLPQGPEVPRDVSEPDRAAITALADTLRQQTISQQEMATALEGLRFSFELAGPAPIESTDARHAADSSIVLFDYSLGAFFALARDKPELVARAQLMERAGTPDHGAVLRALSTQPGVRYEARPEITVRFAP